MRESGFTLSLARSAADLAEVQRLRYRVFVEELGGDGPLVDHAAALERDRFDPHADHLVLRDAARPAGERVVGVYRVMTEAGAARAGAFYSEAEYDLSPLRHTGRRLMELGRSCLHRDYRGGTAMVHLWNGLSEYVERHRVEILFGVASFHGTNTQALAAPLSILHHRHLAPSALRARARAPQAVAMDTLSEDEIDRPAAMRAVPPLIKAYLRLGGFVGEGAWLDRDFNTTDVFLVMDTERMNPKQRALYARPRS